MTLLAEPRRWADPPVAVSPERRPLLAVEHLSIAFRTDRGLARVVDDVSWDVAPGEIVAIVGESGSGKSVTALGLLGLLDRARTRIGGSARFDGVELVGLSERRMRTIRGRSVGMVFQEPMSSLNPLMTIGRQIEEPLIAHLAMSRRDARARVLELLGEVGIADGARRVEQYPHHLSGGMRQRVMIAIGLACRPRLLIADEPTTALDVTIQAQILELMQRLARDHGIALVVITHNLGLVARYADRVHVMYAGSLVEEGPVDALFARAAHPYTIGLLRSVPRLDEPRRAKLETIDGTLPGPFDREPGCRFAPRCAWRRDVCATEPPWIAVDADHRAACHRTRDVLSDERRIHLQAVGRRDPVPTDAALDDPLLSVRGLCKRFDVGRRESVRAVEDVSFDVARGETLGLVGESGCGKSTIGRMILRLVPPTSGDIVFEGRSLVGSGAAPTSRRAIQVVFQDPYGSLNPRRTVRRLLAEPLAVHRLVARDRIDERVDALLAQVGLPASIGSSYPHALSGGQRQRVGIARALALEPSFIVLDEPVSALDVSVQAQVVNLLADLQRSLGIGYLFIGHDLAVVRHLSHRVVVMYLGRVMERADRDALYAEPLHPYTIALLEAAPLPDPRHARHRAMSALGGEPPSPLAPPSGCVFHTRCPRAIDDCRAVVPALREVRPGRHVACIRV